MDKIEQLCGYYLGFLRGVALLHQNHHWVSRGGNFYGNHLLFERIYTSALEDMDAAAEKFVGLFGEDALDIQMQAKVIAQTMLKYAEGGLVENSLRAEKEFQDIAKHLYDTLDEEDKLSMGLDNMLQGISDNSEERAYLLGQVTKGTESSSERVAARINILKKLQKNSRVQ